MEEMLFDRSAEALSGAFGSRRESEIKMRFDWILNRIQGPDVLDVGCSQGALESEAVCNCNIDRITGIDCSRISIEYAKKQVNELSEEQQNKIEFLNCNFLEYGSNTQYDCIVIAEVLEHLENPEEFVNKASMLLKDKGVLIVTVPFAINDYPDHKRTYYFCNLFEQVSKFLPVTEYEILGNWIGMVARKDSCVAINVTLEVFRTVENGFYCIERKLRDSISAKNARIEKLESDREVLRNNIEKLKADKVKLTDRIKNLESDREVLRGRVKDREQRIRELKQ